MPNLQVVIADAIVARGHDVARFAPTAVEAAAEAGGLAWADHLPVTRLPQRAELAAWVGPAVDAGLTALLSPLARMVLSTRRILGRRLQLSSRGLIRERRAVALPLSMVSAGRVGYKPMTEADAAELVQGMTHTDSWAAGRSGMIKHQNGRAAFVLQTGLAEGWTPAQLRRELQDEFAEIKGWDNFVRTEVQRAHNIGLQSMYEANRDIMAGQQYSAALDTRTCPACMGYDGRVYWEEPARGEPSMADLPQPPIHQRCRCVLMPVLKSPGQLAAQFDVPQKKTDKRFSLLTKLATGAVEKVTYAAWLARQPADTQRQALGATRYELYKQGVPVDKFADDGQIVPVADLMTEYA